MQHCYLSLWAGSPPPSFFPAQLLKSWVRNLTNKKKIFSEAGSSRCSMNFPSRTVQFENAETRQICARNSALHWYQISSVSPPSMVFSAPNSEAILPLSKWLKLSNNEKKCKNMPKIVPPTPCAPPFVLKVRWSTPQTMRKLTPACRNNLCRKDWKSVKVAHLLWI